VAIQVAVARVTLARLPIDCNCRRQIVSVVIGGRTNRRVGLNPIVPIRLRVPKSTDQMQKLRIPIAQLSRGQASTDQDSAVQALTLLRRGAEAAFPAEKIPLATKSATAFYKGIGLVTILGDANLDARNPAHPKPSGHVQESVHRH
jgi:hypothetical protein